MAKLIDLAAERRKKRVQWKNREPDAAQRHRNLMQNINQAKVEAGERAAIQGMSHEQIRHRQVLAAESVVCRNLNRSGLK